MHPDIGSSLIGAGGSFLGGLLGLTGGIMQGKHQKHMRNLIRGTRDMQFDMQREAWARDDAAIQRRVEDLKRAGLNPTQAIKGGMQAMSSKGAAGASMAGLPDKAAGLYGIDVAMEGVRAATEIAKSAAEVKLYENQADKVSRETDLTDENVRKQRIENYIAEITQPAVIRQEYNDMVSGVYKINLQELDWIIRKNKVPESELSRMKAEVMQNLGMKDPKVLIVDTLTKMKVLDIMDWDFDWYQKKNQPMKSKPSWIQQLLPNIRAMSDYFNNRGDGRTFEKDMGGALNKMLPPNQQWQYDYRWKRNRGPGSPYNQ